MSSRVWRVLLAVVMLTTALLALSVASPVAAQIEAPPGDCTETGHSGTIDLYDQDCYLYDVQKDRGDFNDGIDDAYDGFGLLFVNSTIDPTNVFSSPVFDPATDGVLGPDGRTVIFPVQSMSGLDVRREVFVPASGGTYGRWYNEFHNPTNSPITVDIAIYGNLGSDGSTVVQNTSSGDQTITAADFWSITTEGSTPFFGDPVIGTVVDGMNGMDKADIFSFYPFGGTNVNELIWVWQSVTVQPGQTIAYVSFSIQQESRAQAQAEAERLSTDPTAWSQGLTATQISRVRNFVSLPVKYMRVDSITMSIGRSSSVCSPAGVPCVVAAVKVVDQNGAAVAGATVTGRFTLPNGQQVTQSAVTDASGVAKFKVHATQRGRARYTFEVTNITKPSDGQFVYVYNPSANVETRDSIVY